MPSDINRRSGTAIRHDSHQCPVLGYQPASAPGALRPKSRVDCNDCFAVHTPVFPCHGGAAGYSAWTRRSTRMSNNDTISLPLNGMSHATWHRRKAAEKDKFPAETRIGPGTRPIPTESWARIRPAYSGLNPAPRAPLSAPLRCRDNDEPIGRRGLSGPIRHLLPRRVRALSTEGNYQTRHARSGGNLGF